MNRLIRLSFLALLFAACTKSHTPDDPAAPSAHSKGEASWQIVHQDDFHAESEKELKALGERFPELLKQAGGKKLKSADVKVVTFKYSGPTRCPDGDPKLSYTSSMIEFCAEDGNCQGESPEHRSEHDPCASTDI